jgi:hypothetical protein
MLHRNSSAGTAAQKSSKCSLIQRPAIILAMLLLCAVFCQGQDIKFSIDTTKHSFLSVSEWTLQIQDSAKGLVAYQKKDSSLVVIDSAATINVLMNTIKQIQEENKKLYAAQDILSYINTQGYVLNKDRIKFNDAVENYFKLSGNKTDYKKMQKLDILIRSVKGKALGWVSQ